MEYTEFEAKFPGYLASVTPDVKRQWKKRDKVPAKAVTEAVTSVTNHESVTAESVTKPESVTKSVTNPQVGVTNETQSVTKGLRVAIPSAEPGHPEFDIMSDGYARGFPGDTWQRTNRTCHAIRRMAERAKGGIHEGPDAAKRMIARWLASPTLETLKKVDNA